MTQWSNPTFIKLSSTSIGAQAGSDSKDMVFFIVGDKESQRFIDESSTFGGTTLRDVVQEVAVQFGGEATRDFNNPGVTYVTTLDLN